MVARALSENTVLQSGGTRVVVEYGEGGRARLDVAADCYDRGSAEAGRLVCEAVHQARLHHADCVACALDASGPACGAILEALHARLGEDVGSIATRRAGSSVMVMLELEPIPVPSPVPVPRRAAIVPAPQVPRQPIGAGGLPAR